MAVSFTNLFRIKEIRSKILITLGLLFCYRIGFAIPLPGVNIEAFLEQMGSAGKGTYGRLMDLMNVLTGARIQSATIFSLIPNFVGFVSAMLIPMA